MKRLKVYKRCNEYEEVYPFKRGFKKVFTHIKHLVEKAGLSEGVECYLKDSGDNMLHPKLNWGHIMYPLSYGYHNINEHRYYAYKYCCLDKIRNHFTDEIKTFYIRGIRFDLESIILNISCNDTKVIGCKLGIEEFFECDNLVEVINKASWQQCPYSISMYGTWC